MREIPADKHEDYFELMYALQQASSRYFKTHGHSPTTEALYLIDKSVWDELQEAHLVNPFNEWKEKQTQNLRPSIKNFIAGRG